MVDPLDCELLELINRLNKVQSKIGGGKSAKDDFVDEGKIDRFLDLKAQMLDRLIALKQNDEQMRSNSGANPRDLMTLQSNVRSDLTKLSEDWRELDLLFRSETKKRKSKFSADELRSRQEALIMFYQEIEGFKDLQRAGYVKGYRTTQMVKMEDSDLFKGKTPGEEYKYNPAAAIARSKNLSDGHRQALLQIRERDKKIDQEIELIGQGVDELGEIAKAANEEVKMQNVLLEDLENKMEEVHDKVLGVNESMRKTLDETRTADKFCVDIFCLIILIGMIVVLVKLVKQ